MAERRSRSVPREPPGSERPGWRNAEILRLQNEAGEARYSARFSSRRDFEKGLDVVKGRVTSLTTRGTWVRIPPGMQALKVSERRLSSSSVGPEHLNVP